MFYTVMSISNIAVLPSGTGHALLRASGKYTLGSALLAVMWPWRLADLVVESNLFCGEDIRAGVRGEGGVCVVAECLHRFVALQKEGKKSII